MNFWSPFIITFLRYTIIAGFIFFIFYKAFPSYFLKNKIQTRIAKTKDFLREISHSFQTIMVISFVSLAIISTPLSNYTQVYFNWSDKPIWWMPLSIILMLIIHDTYFYWVHKGIHHPRLFKYIHLVHHKSVNPTPLASYSFHIYESTLHALIAPLLLFVLPIHPLSLLIFSFLSFIFNVYGHLGYEIAPIWFRKTFLFEVFITSTYHNIHHSKIKGNYGLYFRFWDRVMRTEHPEYVKDYDKIQTLRVILSKETSQTSKIKFSIFSFFTLAYLTIFAATSPKKIESKWKFRINDAIIKIYRDNGLYFGKLMGRRKPENSQKLNKRGTVDLEIVSINKYRRRSLFSPKRTKNFRPL